MERPIKGIAKSKSSNAAPKPEAVKNKKSRSNAEITPLSLKKRGVYVEKKASKLPQELNRRASNPQKNTKTKLPPLPRPNRKRFLSSVLTILSKSTAATQYPDTEDTTNRRCEKIKFKIRKTRESDKPETDKPETDKLETDIVDTPATSKRRKYRSKILNEYKNDLNKFVVLQNKKEIVQTPSHNSERSGFVEPQTIKWSEFLPPLVKHKDDYNDPNYDGGIAKQVLEGLKLKENKVKLTENKINEDRRKEDKGMYNFFVDLLETTFNIYNVKPEHEAASAASSKCALEIDEAVAKKLHVNYPEMYNDNTQNPSKHFCCVPETNWSAIDLTENFPAERAPKKKIAPKTKPKLKTRSFIYNKSQLSAPSTNSMPSKKSTKKNTKKELLDTIKEQLSLDVNVFEEPQNLYQALKVMASHKRKYRNSIHFEEFKTATGQNIPDECMFKRRKLISFNAKSPAKKSNHKSENVHRSIDNKYSDKGGTIKRGVKTDITTDESEHSLEVYGFDYVPLVDKKDNLLKHIEMPYHSSPAQSEQDFAINEALLKYSESGTSSLQNYVDWNRGIRSVTKVIKQY